MKYIDKNYLIKFWERAKGIITNSKYTLNNKSQTVQSAINDLGTNKEDNINKITSWCESPDDSHYPSEKLVKDSLGELQNQINALSLGLKLSLTVSPACGPKNESASYKWTATFAGATPDSIKIFDNTGAEIKSITSATTTNITQTKTFSAKTTYTAKAVYMGMTFQASVAVEVRNRILYGFCTEAAHPTTKLTTAYTTAVGRKLEGTATADGQVFKIYVPTDVTQPTGFSMGGAPATYVKGTNVTINGITYTPYVSGAVYNTGGKVSITLT